MSQRDRKLLEEAGLSIPEAANLFDRSRQALYTGLANERDYFSPQDVKNILDHAREHDLPRLQELTSFIESAYADEPRLLLPEKIGLAQLSRVLRDAQAITLSTNGYTEHLIAGADFATILIEAMSIHPGAVRLILPAEWVVGFIKQERSIPLPPREQIEFKKEVGYLPSFAVIQDIIGRHRAFVFARLSIDEMRPNEADRLWTFLNPSIPNRRGKSAAAR